MYPIAPVCAQERLRLLLLTHRRSDSPIARLPRDLLYCVMLLVVREALADEECEAMLPIAASVRPLNSPPLT